MKYKRFIALMILAALMIAAPAAVFAQGDGPDPVVGDPENGKILYQENCEVCHGEQGEGRVGATLTKVWPGIRPDLNMRSTIANGVPNTAMPAWSQANGGPLSESEIDDITAFILSWEGLTVQSQATQIVPSSPLDPFMTGWGGVIVFIILLVIIFGLIVFLQRRMSFEED